MAQKLEARESVTGELKQFGRVDIGARGAEMDVVLNQPNGETVTAHVVGFDRVAEMRTFRPGEPVSLPKSLVKPVIR